MPRYVAFLRAINVGGHTVKMNDLRAIFEAQRFERVETFISSGNVLFDSDVSDQAKLERSIERALEAELGFPVETFVRSARELSEIVVRHPFDRGRVAMGGRSVYIAFLSRPPTREAAGRLEALGTAAHTFAIVGREAYWLRRGRIGSSRSSSGFLEKTLGMPATLRGLPTLAKIAARLG